MSRAAPIEDSFKPREGEEPEFDNQLRAYGVGVDCHSRFVHVTVLSARIILRPARHLCDDTHGCYAAGESAWGRVHLRPTAVRQRKDGAERCVPVVS